MIKLEGLHKHIGKILIKSSKGKSWELINTITKLCNDELVKGLYGSLCDIQIAYLAIGTGNTIPTRDDTTLETEVFRTSVVSNERSDYGQVLSDFTIFDTDYSGTIEEIGIFGGSTAGAGTDTGTLIARVLWSYTKSSSEELYFQRIDSIL